MREVSPKGTRRMSDNGHTVCPPNTAQYEILLTAFLHRFHHRYLSANQKGCCVRFQIPQAMVTAVLGASPRLAPLKTLDRSDNFNLTHLTPTTYSVFIF